MTKAERLKKQRYEIIDHFILKVIDPIDNEFSLDRMANACSDLFNIGIPERLIETRVLFHFSKWKKLRVMA